MSKVREPEDCQKRSQCERQSTILVQGLWTARCSGAETRLHGRTKRANPISLLRTFQYARHPTHFWGEPSDTGFLAKKKTRPVQNLKRPSCLPNLKMSWKPMKCGHLCKKDGTNVGCGRSCAVELVKSWRLCLEIEARRAVANCGSKSHLLTKVARVTVTSGKPINSFFLLRHMSALAREADKPITWNVGIAL
jgi:hypothetical protein